MSFEGPLFLVGMPRSGTKLLRDLLNRHPAVGIPDIETEFLPWLANGIAGFGDLAQPRAFEAFAREMSQFTYFRLRQGRGPLPTAAQWHAACRRYDAAGVFEALVRLEVDAPPGSGRIWGDKSPSYIDDLPLLRALYPDARVVHIIRDVRDYCLSMRAAWGKDMRRAAQRWVDDVSRARRDGRALGAGYLELRYEDLLAQPARELGRVCEHLGLELLPSMLSLERPTENLGAAVGRTEILSGNRGKFREQMRPAELRRIEAIAGETLRELGYELAQPPQSMRRLTRAEMLAAQARDGWNLLAGRRRGGGLLDRLAFHLRYFRTTRG